MELWVFASRRSTIYTIEETRGGGVARTYLGGATGLLVRDDYRGYTRIPIPQQSCWAHLLRVARDLAALDGASDDVHTLYGKLKTLFALLTEDIRQPFDRATRQELYTWYTNDLKRIMDAPLHAQDAKKVQVRIRQQGSNLLTALLHPEGTLTNNQAERDIRKLVVTRKISGGSQSKQGATTHAVNLKYCGNHCQTAATLDTLQDYLLTGATGRN